MKKTLIPVCLFVMIATTALSQGRYIDDSHLLRDYDVEQVNQSSSPDNVEGSPYLTDDFTSSRIFLRDHQKVIKVRLRFNAYEGQFEFNRNGSIFVMANPQKIDSIHHDDQIFKYIHYRDGNHKMKASYAARLVEGGCAIYKIYRTEFHHAEPPRPGHVDYEPARFELDQPLYLIQLGDDQPCVIESFRKRIFLDRFGSLEKDLKQYIRDEDIHLRKEEDLIRFVRHYNTAYSTGS